MTALDERSGYSKDYTSKQRTEKDLDEKDQITVNKNSRKPYDDDDKHDNRHLNASRHRSSSRNRISSSNRDRSDRDYYDSKQRRDRSRDRDTDRHRDRSRDRHRDRGENKRDLDRDRYSNRSRDRFGSKDRYRDRDRDPIRDNNASRTRESGRDPQRDNYRDRDPDRKRDTYERSDDSLDNPKSLEIPVSIDNESLAVDDDFDISMHINATNIVNRLLELFSDTNLLQDERIDNIIELFHEDCRVSSLKNNKDIIVGVANIRTSFSKTLACASEASKRLFIDLSSYKLINKDLKGNVSYCVDFHKQGSTPGFGDRSKDAILLYKCQNLKILQVWGMVDNDKYASIKDLTKEVLLETNVWKLVRTIIENDLTNNFERNNDKIELNEEADVYFNDYSTIETWG